MSNLILTAVPLIALGVVALYGNKKDDSETYFYSKDYTTVLKGICAIIVMMVHVPDRFVNPLQDAVGSFAYVAVTLFFLTSAYGMHLSLNRSQDYLKHFIRNRLSSLLVPQLIVNIIVFAVIDIILISEITGGTPSWRHLWYLDDYVLTLLEYCVAFFVIALAFSKLHWRYSVYRDIMLIALVAGSSLVMYFHFYSNQNSAQMSWPYERFGLIWGILLYNFFKPICRWLNTKRGIKLILFAIICLILGLAYLRFKPVFFWGEFLLKVVLGLAIIVFLFLLTQGRFFGNAVSRFLGTISFEIYLIHRFTYILVGYIFPEISSGLFILISFAITIVLAYFTHLIDAPLVKLIRAPKTNHYSES